MHELETGFVSLQTQNDAHFFILRFEKEFVSSDLNIPGECSVINEILWVKSGSGQIVIDDEEYEISENSFYLITKGQRRRFTRDTNVDGYYVAFRDSFIENQNAKFNLFNHLRINTRIEYKSNYNVVLDEFFDKLHQESLNSQEGEFGSLDIVKNILRVVLINIERFKQQHFSTSFDDLDVNDGYLIFNNFIKLLEKKYRIFHSVSEYCHELGISQLNLGKISQVYLDKTPREIIEMRIVTEAVRMMKHDGKSTKDISQDLGFDNLTFFNKTFKKIMGMHPNKYIELFID
ncbi:helix-turn-helix domain-containing protein [Aureibacter tunicatorum]|uniref:YesN/AraC family two-component response regulator n=1 Tax=Aureibacter tunicatorum TaxID=866807 RepID=A0AAE3XJP5_9BACT|nr:helix-turn-helix domain-containing protein [Aureibacter tunicatorum]MDR6237710.1 YesN/AraC family two-component response regulator [Aureibacter tunicatorum]BDD02745.1 hypothetical protein AUTU_02280 [Aureibacter tunicatorum]